MLPTPTRHNPSPLALLALQCFLIPCLLFGSSTILNASNQIEAVYTSSPPRIDGTLDEQVWDNAASVTTLIQRLPRIGQPSSEDTEFLILYDKGSLYIGIKCADDPRNITANELARDVSLGHDDRVQIILDTFLDKRNGYWFQIGPKGSIGDALVSENGASFNKQWDGLWEGKARIHDTGWDAEIAIPFKTLNFQPGQSSWGLKLIRNIIRKQEVTYWPVANLNSYRFQISDAGLLTGLEGITKGIGLDIRPYAITGFDHPQSDSSTYIRNDNPSFNLGGDIFYRATPGLKAALTFNTDFAQTEVDSRQINLTRFSLLFPEKRDFFLDGAQYFNFGLGGDQTNRYARRNIAFFSRRIGLDQDGNPIPILWGAKLTGQTGPWNIGFQSITDKPDGRRVSTVARVTRNLGAQSYVGVIGTIGSPSPEVSNRVIGLDLRLATAQFRKDRILAFTAFGLKSSTEGLEGQDVSWGAEVNYPNDLLKFRIGHQEIGENYRAGIGFVPRVGIRESYLEAAFGPRPNQYGVLQVGFGAGFDYIADFEKRLLTRQIPITPLEITFLSGDQIGLLATSTYEYLDEAFEIFPKESIRIPEGVYEFWRFAVELETAQRRRVWVKPGYEFGSFFDGRRQDFTVELGYKISTPIFVGLGYETSKVYLSGGEFDTHIYRVNANVFFSPDISLTNFVQYDNVSGEVGWQSRFRWIVKPGNEILFVWNSSSIRQPEADRFRIEESLARLKINYNLRF
jgi:hypothetical protein